MPKIVIKAIASIYKAPEFRIIDMTGYSLVRLQRAGIRQGCPLSPYLFIIQMTIILNDAREAEDNQFTLKTLNKKYATFEAGFGFLI